MSADTAPRADLTPRAVGTAWLGLLTGALSTHMLPHLLHGLADRAFPTPFGLDSSPTVNLAWGLAHVMLVVAVLVLARQHIRRPSFVVGTVVGTVVGAAVGAVGVATAAAVAITTLP